jgi:hypothetical protein
MCICNSDKNLRGWRNIKFLSEYSWYRKISGGKWYCIIFDLSRYGFKRRWKRPHSLVTDKIVVVQFENYIGGRNYKWVIGWKKKIFINRGDVFYYSVKKSFWGRKVFLRSTPIKREIWVPVKLD